MQRMKIAIVDDIAEERALLHARLKKWAAKQRIDTELLAGSPFRQPFWIST